MESKDLKAKKLPELKKMAKEKNIKLKAGIKKDELIKILLASSEKPTAEKPNKQETLQEITPKKIDINKIPDIPVVYGKDKLIFMIKDPNWGFVYWEFSEDKIRTHNIYNDNIDKYLRVYDISDGKNPENPYYFIDVKINLAANNWYLDFLAPNKAYIIDLGYIKEGRFTTVLRSNTAATPRDAVSDQIDQDWMLTDEQFRVILLASGLDARGNYNSGVSSSFSVIK